MATKIDGRGSEIGTFRYAERHRKSNRHFHTTTDRLSLSTLGLGTYLGSADDAGDAAYRDAVATALGAGINVLDSAINYRFQRSERAIGAALAIAIGSGAIQRDEVVISTKGGFVPFDGAPPKSREEFAAYLNRSFFEPGLCQPEDMSRGGQHCMTPRYLEHQLRSSMINLGLGTIDIYFIHNPETQLEEVGRVEFERRIRAAFTALEGLVSAGRIARYGVATWDGFRVAPSDHEFLSLERLVALAREVAGSKHHFAVIQLPYNRTLSEAHALSNQPLGDRRVSTLEAALALGLEVYASASIHQGALAASAGGALSAIQQVRSTPGISTALVGMRQSQHVRENVAVFASD